MFIFKKIYERNIENFEILLVFFFFYLDKRDDRNLQHFQLYAVYYKRI